VKLKARYLPTVLPTALVAIIATVILGPPVILLSLITSSGRPAYIISRIWGWLISKTAGVTFSLQGGDKVVPGVSYIITPNHQGNIDILALMLMLPTPYRWVIKKELEKIPIFGWALRRMAVSINRANKVQAVRTLRQGADKLKEGWSLLIYPEGTRTPDGNLQDFKKGAFMMAVDTGVPILPVTINGAFKILPKKTLDLTPGHITVTISDPIPTEGLTEKDVPQLMESTRAAIMEHLDPDYDPFDHCAHRSLREGGV
jgi:1-acyl-sn-glycerol-3-phosphate acyltransferase